MRNSQVTVGLLIFLGYTMWKTTLLAASIAVSTALCSSSPIFAATIFDVTSFNGSYSGTLTIDTVHGTFLAGDIVVVGQPLHFTAPSEGSFGLALGTSYSAFPTFVAGVVFEIDSFTGLIGFSGGDIMFAGSFTQCLISPSSWNCGGGSRLGAGTITEASPVPSPVVGAGLPSIVMALGGLLFWRRRRAAA